ERGGGAREGGERGVGVEPPVLDGDEGLGQIGRHLLERDGSSAHVAARRERPAAEAENLDRGRALRNFERLDRRQVRADPGNRADAGNHRPQAHHETPVAHAAEHRAPFVVAAVVASAALPAALALFLARLGLDLGAAPARLLVLVVLVVLVVIVLARLGGTAAPRARLIFGGALAAGA